MAKIEFDLKLKTMKQQIEDYRNEYYEALKIMGNNN